MLVLLTKEQVMTKGVRAFAISTFNKMLPQLDKLGGTEFRRKIMNAIQEKFDTTVASAATNYNHAFKLAREENPDSLIGLGRNPITASSAGGNRPRKVGAAGKRGAAGRAAANGNGNGGKVTVVRESSGAVVAEGVSRQKAKNMVESSGGRGRPRLIIQEDQE
jgi:hypothetical protein